MPKSSREMPSSSSRCPAATRTFVPPVVGTLTCRCSRSTRGAPSPIAAKTAAAWSRSARLVTRASRTSPPIRAFNSSAVPLAITLPESITTMWCAKCSASSMYCVVSNTVVPSATRSSMKLHKSLRVRGSRPVVGSSKKSTRGRPIRLAPTSRRRRMPPEYVFTSLSPASTSENRSRTSWARRRRSVLLRWYKSPTSSRFSRPVSISSTAAY